MCAHWMTTSTVVNLTCSTRRWRGSSRHEEPSIARLSQGRSEPTRGAPAGSPQHCGKRSPVDAG